MVRRLVLALAVVAVMTGALAVAPSTMGGVKLGPDPAVAQPGALDYCGPWQQTWHVSSGGWWYFWWWRWCHNPLGSVRLVHRLSRLAVVRSHSPGMSPGFQYTGPPPS
jgi:hypothetical protein